MSINFKLLFGFVSVAALVAAVGFFGHAASRSVELQLNRLTQDSVVEVINSTEMSLGIRSSHLAIYDLIAELQLGSADPVNAIPAAQRVEETRQEIRAHLNDFQRSLARSRQTCETLRQLAIAADNESLARREQAKLDGQLKELSEEFRKHRTYINDCLQLAGQDLPAAQKYARDALHVHYSEHLLPLIEQQRRVAERDFREELRLVEESVTRTGQFNRTAALLALLVAVLLGTVISRSIGKPLARLKEAAARIGQGQLDTRLDVTSHDEIGLLAGTFNQMAADLQTTTVSKAYVDNILQSMREILIVADAQIRIETCNRAAVEQLGYEREQLIGQPLETLFIDPAVCRNAQGQIPLELLGGRELELRTRSGAALPMFFSASELRNPQQQFAGVVCAALNIAERKLVEQKLRTSLDEKELLLKEVHHRVKNNLQIISSLLTLQARGTGDPELTAMFQECQGRIRSMALIHEQLYRSADLARIDFAQYVTQLSHYLTRSLASAEHAVTVKVDVAAVELDLDVAIPCGMIVNELVMNAIQHAFPPGQPGEIVVSYRVDAGTHTLSVRDNGRGFPQEAAADGASLGLKVVQVLTRQLGGHLEIRDREGTESIITFFEAGIANPAEGETSEHRAVWPAPPNSQTLTAADIPATEG